VLIKQHAGIGNSTAKIIYLGRRPAQTVLFASVRAVRPELPLSFVHFGLRVVPGDDAGASGSMRYDALEGAPPGWLNNRRLLI